jgi:iron complex transport system ATP-binding protein
MNQPLIEARQLRVSIGDKAIIDRLNLGVASGERLAILGRNGAGKSTLLSTLAGLRKPAGGAVLLEGDAALLHPRQAALRRPGWVSSRTIRSGRRCWKRPSPAATRTSAAGTGNRRAMPNWPAAPCARWAWPAWRSARSTPCPAANASAWPSPRCSPRRHRSTCSTNPCRTSTSTTRWPCSNCLPALPATAAPASSWSCTTRRWPIASATGRCWFMATARPGPVDDILTAATLSELYGYGLRQIEDRGHRCFIPE